jgi:hypothetical protein
MHLHEVISLTVYAANFTAQRCQLDDRPSTGTPGTKLKNVEHAARQGCEVEEAG